MNEIDAVKIAAALPTVVTSRLRAPTLGTIELAVAVASANRGLSANRGDRAPGPRTRATTAAHPATTPGGAAAEKRRTTPTEELTEELLEMRPRRRPTTTAAATDSGRLVPARPVGDINIKYFLFRNVFLLV